MLKDKQQRLYITLKTAISVGAWIIALIGAFYTNNFDSLKFLLPALIMCTFGDVFLALSDEVNIRLIEPYFTLGVASFGIAHIIFGAYFLVLCGFQVSWFLVLSPVTFLMLWGFKRAGVLKCDEYASSTMVYSLLVGAFLGLGINLIVTGEMNEKSIVLCIAAALFWSSDVSLSFRYFTKKFPLTLGIVVLTTYFAAIYMIAFSTFA